MPRKRNNNPPKLRDNRVTPAAKALFREMRLHHAHCRHAGGDHCGIDCARYWQLNEQLSKELRLEVWQYPAFEIPDADCPHPAGSAAARWWPAAQDLFRALEAA